MPAGIHYDLNPMAVGRELCRVDTIKRLSGGVNLADESLPIGSTLMPLIPLHVDLVTRRATVVKRLRVAEDATSSTKIKIAKGANPFVGMNVGTGSSGAVITAIDTSNASYDEITVGAAMTVTKGAILFEATSASGTSPKNVANYLNYAVTKVEPGATVTPIYRAYEVQESKLYAPLTDEDKEALGDNFTFIP